MDCGNGQNHVSIDFSGAFHSLNRAAPVMGKTQSVKGVLCELIFVPQRC
jgi:hypothetical protein